GGGRRRPAGRHARHNRPDRPRTARAGRRNPPGAAADRPQERVGSNRRPPVATGGLRVTSKEPALPASASLAERAARVELLLLDVDGVLTDGRIVYADDGTELKRFHVRDGSGLKLWHLAGKRAAVVSGRNSPAVGRRAAELG